MPELIAAIAIIDKFITLGKELAKIPAMVLPQYQSAGCRSLRNMPEDSQSK